MHDRETGSLWSQITGECISGELVGETLQLLPSRHTTFAEFKAAYPDGRLLTKPAKGPAGSRYANYFASPERLGIFGRANTVSKLPGKALVYGIRLEGNAVAVAESYLAEHGFLLTTLSETPIIITYDPAGKAASAFHLPMSNISEVAVEDDWVVDNNQRKWHAATGIAAESEEAALESLPLISAFWFAWVNFFPNTELVQ